ncbi:MAG: PIN domain-containing protein [Microbacteriaceae bacterium]|nr:PIN domain-containing protein [Microbacteriaceae bacterium]
MTSRGLLDTNALISWCEGRPIDLETMPDELYVSAFTLGELEHGNHTAPDATARRARTRTWALASECEPLDTDLQVASEWALLRHLLETAGRRVRVNDLWIAAIAIAHDLPVVTRDEDFDAIAAVSRLQVITV